MQTFLPYKNYSYSAKVLDRQRLGKQRVEAYQILRALLNIAGWQNHPATKMWRGYEGALVKYIEAICNEWTSRGYKDTILDKTHSLVKEYSISFTQYPDWLGNESFHSSHRSNLLRKNYDYYKAYNWNESIDLPYIWPEN